MTEPHNHMSAGSEREPLIGLVASLAAAISLLENTPKAKKAAASDKMFEVMLSDYRKALEAGREFARKYRDAYEHGYNDGCEWQATHGTCDVAQAEKHPSVEAMKAAVELEIHSALGHVKTVVIGEMIQKAIDAAIATQPPAAPVETDDLVEVVIACCNGQMGREAAIEVISELDLAGFKIVPAHNSSSAGSVPVTGPNVQTTEFEDNSGGAPAWHKIQDQIDEWAQQTLPPDHAAAIMSWSDRLAQHLCTEGRR